MVFILVCEKCKEHTKDDASIEINFSDSSIYYLCPKCKHMNKMTIKPLEKPLAKTRLSK